MNAGAILGSALVLKPQMNADKHRFFINIPLFEMLRWRWMQRCADGVIPGVETTDEYG